MTDVNMYMFIEKGIRGGICNTMKRHSLANNKYCKDYDQNKPEIFLAHFDVNNLYGKNSDTRYIRLGLSNQSLIERKILLENTKIGYSLIAQLKQGEERGLNGPSTYTSNCLVPRDKQLRVNLEDGAKLPTKATPDSGCYDLFCNQVGTLAPGERKLIKTGVKMQIPHNCFGKIFSRSSLAIKGIDVSAGIIDADFTGEILVLLINNSMDNFGYVFGDKIAQIAIIEHKDLTAFVGPILNTKRGIKGFGSSDK
ncbi:uncharacterized protein LOC128964733 [Oppia nitens]|uniref:uncharacterized protein LOC128964733 n=1 Tax=Oppia nitens TaxID=1686743 RepID=UPI0023DB615A|nr:uncharacterized protein LOC128964733 [Oppia nitens]